MVVLMVSEMYQQLSQLHRETRTLICSSSSLTCSYFLVQNSTNSCA